MSPACPRCSATWQRHASTPGIGRVPGTGAEQCRGAESRGRHASASQGTSWEEQRGRGRLFIAARAIIRSWCRGAGRLLAVQAQSEQWDGGLGAHGGMEGRAVPDRSCLPWLAALRRKNRNSHCPSLPFSPRYSSGFQSPVPHRSTSFRAWKIPFAAFLPPWTRDLFCSSLLLPRSIYRFSHSLFIFPLCLLVDLGVLLLITLPAPLLGEILPSPFLTDVKGIKQYLLQINIFKSVSLDRLLWLAALVRG